MIVVAVMALQCWIGALVVRYYRSLYGPVALSFDAWVWVLKEVLGWNGVLLTFASPAFALWHSWRFLRRLRRAFRTARCRPLTPHAFRSATDEVSNASFINEPRTG